MFNFQCFYNLKIQQNFIHFSELLIKTVLCFILIIFITFIVIYDIENIVKHLYNFYMKTLLMNKGILLFN